MSAAPFFVTGGTIRPNAPCYIERRADRDLLEALEAGQFCYVLTARQMGKSSLMVRTATRLRSQGAHVAILDLTASGRNLTPEQWYNGLLQRLGQQLKLEKEVQEFWNHHAELGPLQRWTETLRAAILPALRARSDQPLRLFIFVDEIDVVQSLTFSTDEFFAGIREFYNRRSLEPELAAVSFCLLGVAAPQDLISDSRITPFNIGRRIELRDFTLDEAKPLANGLLDPASQEPSDKERRYAIELVKRALHWTGGHPYLTQRLCAALAERQKTTVIDRSAVDELCQELFLSRKARDSDDNLVYVRERVLNSTVDKNALLDLYRQLHLGKTIEDSETNPLAAELKLAGLTRSEDGQLVIRNRIYQTAFDLDWTTANMSSAEIRRQAIAYDTGFQRALNVIDGFATAALVVFVLGALGYSKLLENNLKKARTSFESLSSQHMQMSGPVKAARQAQLRTQEMNERASVLQRYTENRFPWGRFWEFFYSNRVENIQFTEIAVSQKHRQVQRQSVSIDRDLPFHKASRPLAMWRDMTNDLPVFKTNSAPFAIQFVNLATNVAQRTVRTRFVFDFFQYEQQTVEMRILLRDYSTNANQGAQEFVRKMEEHAAFTNINGGRPAKPVFSYLSIRPENDPAIPDPKGKHTRATVLVDFERRIFK